MTLPSLETLILACARWGCADEEPQGDGFNRAIRGFGTVSQYNQSRNQGVDHRPVWLNWRSHQQPSFTTKFEVLACTEVRGWLSVLTSFAYAQRCLGTSSAAERGQCVQNDSGPLLQADCRWLACICKSMRLWCCMSWTTSIQLLSCKHTCGLWYLLCGPAIPKWSAAALVKYKSKYLQTLEEEENVNFRDPLRAKNDEEDSTKDCYGRRWDSAEPGQT